MTNYTINGQSISHTTFVALCNATGIHARANESLWQAIHRLADNGNQAAIKLSTTINCTL